MRLMPPRPGATQSHPALPTNTGLLERSPESARIVLYASNDFMSDQVLNSIVAASGTQYLGPLELFMNTLDWALQDEQLLSIRSRGHFNRTLPPMERRVQQRIEYVNYGLALLLLSCSLSETGCESYCVVSTIRGDCHCEPAQ